MIVFTSDFVFGKSPAARSRWRGLVGCALAIGLVGPALAAEVDLTPVSTTDGAYTQVTVAGQTAWQNTGTSRYLHDYGTVW